MQTNFTETALFNNLTLQLKPFINYFYDNVLINLAVSWFIYMNSRRMTCRLDSWWCPWIITTYCSWHSWHEDWFLQVRPQYGHSNWQYSPVKSSLFGPFKRVILNRTGPYVYPKPRTNLYFANSEVNHLITSQEDLIVEEA